MPGTRGEHVCCIQCMYALVVEFTVHIHECYAVSVFLETIPSTSAVRNTKLDMITLRANHFRNDMHAG